MAKSKNNTEADAQAPAKPKVDVKEAMGSFFSRTGGAVLVGTVVGLSTFVLTAAAFLY